MVGYCSLPVVTFSSSLHAVPLCTIDYASTMLALAVFEPRYLALFRDLQAAAPQGSSASEAKFAFGHILSASSAPPALMQDSVGGLPACGVCATVKGIEELENGKLQVRQ
jgi:Lon protease-like protein